MKRLVIEVSGLDEAVIEALRDIVTVVRTIHLRSAASITMKVEDPNDPAASLTPRKQSRQRYIEGGIVIEEYNGETWEAIASIPVEAPNAEKEEEIDGDPSSEGTEEEAEGGEAEGERGVSEAEAPRSHA